LGASHPSLNFRAVSMQAPLTKFYEYLRERRARKAAYHGYDRGWVFHEVDEAAWVQFPSEDHRHQETRGVRRHPTQ